jgi:hypothetical protein
LQDIQKHGVHDINADASHHDRIATSACRLLASLHEVNAAARSACASCSYDLRQCSEATSPSDSNHWRRLWEQDAQALRAAALERSTKKMAQCLTDAAKERRHPIVLLLALVISAYCYAGDIDGLEDSSGLPFDLLTENALKDALCALLLSEEGRSNCPPSIAHICKLLKVRGSFDLLTLLFACCVARGASMNAGFHQ